MKNFFVFLIILSFSLLYTGCLIPFKDKIPYEWVDKKTEPKDYLKVIIEKTKTNNYTLEFNGLLPVGTGGMRAYILEDIKIVKDEKSGNILTIQILPIIKYVGKESSDNFDKIKIYKFNKKMKIRIPENTEEIQLIFSEKLQKISLPLEEKRIEIIITP